MTQSPAPSPQPPTGTGTGTGTRSGTGTATSTGAATVTGTGPEADPRPSAGPEQVIAEARQRIDAIDAEIITLVKQRCGVSAEVQRARMGAGGRRVHLAREMEILRAYGDALGRPGTALAMALLELGRGKI